MGFGFASGLGGNKTGLGVLARQVISTGGALVWSTVGSFIDTLTADFYAGTKAGTATATDQYVMNEDEVALSFPYASKNANLKAYWRFESDCTDETGVNDGTAVGMTYSPSGKFDYGGSFDGGDRMEVDNDASLDTGHLTLSVWFYAASNALSQQRCLICKPFTRVSAPYYQYTMSVLNYGIYPKTLAFQINAGGTRYSILAKNTGWEYGQWNHVCCTYDGSVMKIYLNGVYKAQNTAPSGDITAYNTKQYIGTTGFPTSMAYWLGRIDEVQVWDDALDQTEITALYNDGDRHVKTGTFISQSRTIPAGNKLDSVYITLDDADATHYVDKVEILNATLKEVLATSTTNITSDGKNLVADWDVDLQTISGAVKYKLTLAGDGATTCAVEEVEEVYGKYT